MPELDSYSPTQIARRYGLHVSTVYRWLGKGVRGHRLATRWKGGRLAILARDLEQFLNWSEDTNTPPVQSASPPTKAVQAGVELEKMLTRPQSQRRRASP